MPRCNTFRAVRQKNAACYRANSLGTFLVWYSRNVNDPTVPRISPMPFEEQDDEIRELLAKASVDDSMASNVFTTLVRHRGLFRKWSPFGGKLIAGKLSAHDRELLILRTGWLCKCEYEFGQHSLVAKANGFSDDDLRKVKDGPNAQGWDEWDRTLLKAADELHYDASVTDATWEHLSARYDEPQLIELVMLVGQYHLVAFCLNALRVQREPGVPGFNL